MHYINHLSDAIANLGPMRLISARPLERLIGSIKSSIKSRQKPSENASNCVKSHFAAVYKANWFPTNSNSIVYGKELTKQNCITLVERFHECSELEGAAIERALNLNEEAQTVESYFPIRSGRTLKTIEQGTPQLKYGQVLFMYCNEGLHFALVKTVFPVKYNAEQDCHYYFKNDDLNHAFEVVMLSHVVSYGIEIGSLNDQDIGRVNLVWDRFLELTLEKRFQKVAYCKTDTEMDEAVSNLKTFLLTKGNCKINGYTAIAYFEGTSNRVEGTRSAIKAALAHISSGRISTVTSKIDTWYRQRRLEENRQCGVEMLEIRADLIDEAIEYRFKNLSKPALISDNDDVTSENCRCSCKLHYILPCYHQLAKCDIIPLEMVPERGRIRQVDDYDTGTADEIEELPEEFHNSLYVSLDHDFQHEENERGKSNDGVELASFPELHAKIFSTLREIDDLNKSVVAEQLIVEVLHDLTEVKEKLLGSKFDLAAILPPLTNMKIKGKKPSTHRLEIAYQIKAECNNNSILDSNDLDTDIYEINSCEEPLNEEHMGYKHEGDINNMILEVSLSSNFKLDDITAVYSPVGDGQCGFRCLAMPFYGDQSQWMEVKDVMARTFQMYKHTLYEGRVNNEHFEEILTFKDSPCAPHFYFNAADCLHHSRALGGKNP
ncbi:uncharacterized protein EV154DRAFT_568138 [Mucor mucedo]|uniref:uncharacterized protein n=1 Tax=Mucor mucedo TaxID=29922 RepID=UPI00221FEA85|nr:uncharacterized protein EV154DRAFT_568138 [Mucor mucedo]KAI7882288.1 hypothetical protein EV154DRAFT_568138 [Mucor mucedo]